MWDALIVIYSKTHEVAKPDNQPIVRMTRKVSLQFIRWTELPLPDAQTRCLKQIQTPVYSMDRTSFTWCSDKMFEADPNDKTGAQNW